MGETSARKLRCPTAHPDSFISSLREDIASDHVCSAKPLLRVNPETLVDSSPERDFRFSICKMVRCLPPPGQPASAGPVCNLAHQTLIPSSLIHDYIPSLQRQRRSCASFAWAHREPRTRKLSSVCTLGFAIFLSRLRNLAFKAMGAIQSPSLCILPAILGRLACAAPLTGGA